MCRRAGCRRGGARHADRQAVGRLRGGCRCGRTGSSFEGRAASANAGLHGAGANPRAGAFPAVGQRQARPPRTAGTGMGARRLSRTAQRAGAGVDRDLARGARRAASGHRRQLLRTRRRLVAGAQSHLTGAQPAATGLRIEAAGLDAETVHCRTQWLSGCRTCESARPVADAQWPGRECAGSVLPARRFRHGVRLRAFGPAS
ncbi:hypothetical protein D3C85_777360 [compost metagenome]